MTATRAVAAAAHAGLDESVLTQIYGGLMKQNTLRAFLAIARRMSAYYSQECAFFLKAKLRYLAQDDLPSDCKSLLIRKRGHHLERFLFHPKAYPEDTGENCARDLEKLLAEPDRNVAPRLEHWARRLLREYRDGIGCVLLNEESKRPKAAVKPDDLMRLLKQRRSRRIFLSTPLTVQEKLSICEAAQAAPSSCNRQSLELIFVEEEKLKRFVTSTIPGATTIFHEAPCIIVVVADVRDYRYPEDRLAPYLDAAAAVENVYLFCESSGLGCCWGSYSSFGSVLNEKEVRRTLRIPDSHVIAASIAVGKSDQSVCDIPRDAPADRISLNYFGNRPGPKFPLQLDSRE
jgi:nitroreductase